MVRWTEIIAAGTILLFAWSVIGSSSPPTTTGPTVRNVIPNPFRPPRRPTPAVPGYAGFIDPPEPYRDYSNLVIRDGKVVGGL